MLRKLIFQIFLFFSSHIPVTCAHCDKSNSKRCAKKTSFFPTPLLPPCYTHFQKYPSLSFVGIPRTFLSTHTNTFVNIRDFFPLSMYMCFCCGFFFLVGGFTKMGSYCPQLYSFCFNKCLSSSIFQTNLFFGRATCYSQQPTNNVIRA